MYCCTNNNDEANTLVVCACKSIFTKKKSYLL
jgi:hypothetical protein